MLNDKQTHACKVKSPQKQGISHLNQNSQELSSVSDLGAELFSVSREKFDDWKWQLKIKCVL